MNTDLPHAGDGLPATRPPLFAAADERAALLDAELASARAAHAARRATTLAVCACMAHARRMMPTLAAVDPAAAWHVCWQMTHGTEDDFRYMLWQVCSSGYVTYAAECAAERDIYELAGEGDYLAPSPISHALATEPRVKRADGTVRGHIRRTVVGSPSGASGDVVALDARDVLRLTDEWCAANGVELPPLIGTDDYSWQELHDGRLLSTDDGMGNSLVGRGGRRIRLASRGTRVRYRRDGVTTVTYPDRVATTRQPVTGPRVTRTRWNGATVHRVVNSVRGHIDKVTVTRQNRTRFTRHSAAETLPPATVSTRAARAARAAAQQPDPTLTAATAAATIAEWCQTQHGTGITSSARWTIDQYGTVTARHDADARSYRITLTTRDADGRAVSRKLTDTRRLATVTTALSRALTAA